MPEVKCTDCQTQYDVPENIPDGSYVTCPSCGSRLFFQTLSGTVEAKSVLSYKGKRAGKRGWFRSGKVGASWSTKFKRWMRREMDLDKENDQYKEVVIDPSTGQVIHKTNEPLTQHQGHGSAKHKRSKPKS